MEGEGRLVKRLNQGSGRPDGDPEGLILESWAQGFMVGTLVFMACITVANMRRRTLLHKLILTELILGMGHGTFIFAKEPAYGWYLSVTAIGLNMSWSLHNVIAWMKNKPFLSRKVSMFYIGTVILVQPYWVLEIYANFAYFNNINKIFEKTRPWEPLCRDPWWIYTTCSLFWVIKSQYGFGIFELVRESPRFGVMLFSMCISIAFIIVDILSVVRVFEEALPMGINPFWKLSFVFKCLCDTVILDDFKTALDRLRDYWLVKNQLEPMSRASRGGPRSQSNIPGISASDNMRLEDLGVIEPARCRTTPDKEGGSGSDHRDQSVYSHDGTHPDRMV